MSDAAGPSAAATGSAGVAAAQAWSLMSEVVLRVSTHKQDMAAELGLSFARTRALRRVASAGPLPMRELVTLLGSDAPYVTVVVDDLESRGLVRREPHPTDRRAKLVAVTPAGRKLARRAEAILARPPAVFERLSTGQVEQLLTLLQVLTD